MQVRGRDIETGRSLHRELRRHVRAACMPKPPIEPRYVSVREAARRAGVSRSRIYELLKSGEIDAVKDGARTLVIVASLDAWLDRLKPWRPSAAPLLPSEDQALAKERLGEPDFAGLFAERFESLVPGLGEDEARTRAIAHVIRAYRKYHECDFRTARLAVMALVEPRVLAAGEPETAL
jgi:excisionase family DNA binding protein